MKTFITKNISKSLITLDLFKWHWGALGYQRLRPTRTCVLQYKFYIRVLIAGSSVQDSYCFSSTLWGASAGWHHDRSIKVLFRVTFIEERSHILPVLVWMSSESLMHNAPLFPPFFWSLALSIFVRRNSSRFRFQQPLFSVLSCTGTGSFLVVCDHDCNGGNFSQSFSQVGVAISISVSSSDSTVSTNRK